MAPFVGAVVAACGIAATVSAASSWNPTLLVNTEAFQVIDASDTAANVELRFGDSLNAVMQFDRTNNRFDFSTSVYVRGNVTLTGALTMTRYTTSGGVLYSSGSQVVVSPKGSSGQVLVSRETAAPLWKYPKTSMVWYLGGTAAVGSNKGANVTMPFAMTATSVNLRATGAPTGQALIVDILKDGATLFGTKPQIDAAASSGGSNAVFSVTSLTAGSVITVNVTQVGSTFAGSGITIQLNGTRTF